MMIKLYQLQCDGGCGARTTITASSSAALRAARSDGWIRIKTSVRVSISGKVVIGDRHDYCPVCSERAQKQLTADIADAVKTAGEQRAVELAARERRDAENRAVPL